MSSEEEETTKRERPLSVELRANEFIKIFQPVHEKMFVPVAVDACEVFEPRKGAFAALGRCAKCNFREQEHKSYNGVRETPPKWAGRTRANCAVSTFEDGSRRSSVFAPSLKHQNHEAATRTTMPTSNTNLPTTTTTISEARRLSISPILNKTVQIHAGKEDDNNQETVVAVANDNAMDLGDDIHEVEDVDDDDESTGRRPSWAPPPLIDASEVHERRDSSASPPMPTSSPTKKSMRTMSWLIQRSGSSTASDTSASSMGSPGMGPKRSSLRLLATQIRAKMSKAKDTWESRIGDALPTCNRCRRPIEPDHKIVNAGMARAHEVCPTKEESERGPRNSRYMVQKAQGRVVLTFRCDGDTKQPYSFIFDLDPESKMRCLRMRNNEEMILIYVVDKSAHAALERKFKVPKAREFDIAARYTKQLSFTNPATGETVTPELNLETKRVTVTKYCTSNQVLHTISARFVYDEQERIIKPEHLEFRYSMMPGAHSKLSTVINPRRASIGTIARRLEERARAKGNLPPTTPIAASTTTANATMSPPPSNAEPVVSDQEMIEPQQQQE